jgi:hypothetical protein
MQTTALFVDSYARTIATSVVSVTKVADQQLVVRFGAVVGNLWQLTANGYPFRPNMPVIVTTRGYSAMSSAGFVDVVAEYSQYLSALKAQIVGIQGMPWMEHKGLKRCKTAIDAYVLPANTEITQLNTHAGRKPGAGWHSNTATAFAARQGIALRSKLRRESVFVVEGQSDYAQAWELNVPYNEMPNTDLDWPWEHRMDMFVESSEPETHADFDTE